MIAATAVLAGCGEDGSHFKIEGRLLQMNQSEFYVYSTDGDLAGIDTIKVRGGRFAYETQCEHPMTLTIVFPNYSELPIYAEPGKTASISGDASHLKMLKVKGTKTNELMSSFREQIANASPPEIKKYASQFVADHPDSPIGLWLIRKYFIATPTPDYKEALRLAKMMQDRQKENPLAAQMVREATRLSNTDIGKTLPPFSATDIDGNTVNSASLMTGTVVINTFATWSYNSYNTMNQLKKAIEGNNHVKVISISADASKRDCANFIKSSGITWQVICTGEMFETPLLSQLGMMAVPANMVVTNGRIVARDLSTQDLVKRLN